MSILATPLSRNGRFALPVWPYTFNTTGVPSAEGVIQSSSVDSILAEVAAEAGTAVVTLDLINTPTTSGGPDGDVEATVSATVGTARQIITLAVPKTTPRACYVARLTVSAPSVRTPDAVRRTVAVWSGAHSEAGSATFDTSTTTIVGVSTAFTSALVGGYIARRRTIADDGAVGLDAWLPITGYTDATHVTVATAPGKTVAGASFAFGVASPVGTSWQATRPAGVVLHRWEVA